MSGQSGPDEVAFRALYDATNRQVLAYCRRRCAHASAAQDVAAETYLVAWRRWADVPGTHDEALLWLFAVARRVLSNQRRTVRRQRRLTAKVAAFASTGRPSTEERVAARAEGRRVLSALATLSDLDQEVLRLAAWEGLDGASIAAVLGCSRDAAYVRLHRAQAAAGRRLRGDRAARRHRSGRPPGRCAMTEDVMALLRAADPVPQRDGGPRLVPVTDPLWATVQQRLAVEGARDRLDADGPTVVHVATGVEEGTMDAGMRVRGRIAAALAVAAAVGVVLALVATRGTAPGADDAPVVGAPQPLAFEAEGSAGDVFGGRLVVRGAAVDADALCDEAGWVHVGAMLDDGTDLGRDDFLGTLDASTSLSWDERYRCLDGRGTFTLRHDPQLTIAELEAVPLPATLSTWRVVDSSGGLLGVTGEGTLVMDLEAGTATLVGELVVP